MANFTPQNAPDGHQQVFDGDEAIYASVDPSGTPADKYITPADIAKNYLYLYKLSVTLSTNDLVVALKDLDGNNASATNPIRVRVGDAEHTLAAALSVTAAAGTNWCNAGGSELATKSVGYFVYLGYNATDGVTIGFSRIPYAVQYSDFSATSTAETFCKINDITNASASDVYQLIGYFEATLSAGAGYTWTSPTNIVSQPRNYTNWITWTPTASASGSLTYTGVTFSIARYKITDRKLEYVVKASGTLGGSASNSLLFTLPMEVSQIANVPSMGYGNVAGVTAYLYAEAGTPDKVVTRKYDNSNHATSGSAIINVAGMYEI